MTKISFEQLTMVFCSNFPVLQDRALTNRRGYFTTLTQAIRTRDCSDYHLPAPLLLDNPADRLP